LMNSSATPEQRAAANAVMENPEAGPKTGDAGDEWAKYVVKSAAAGVGNSAAHLFTGQRPIPQPEENAEAQKVTDVLNTVTGKTAEEQYKKDHPDWVPPSPIPFVPDEAANKAWSAWTDPNNPISSRIVDINNLLPIAGPVAATAGDLLKSGIRSQAATLETPFAESTGAPAAAPTAEENLAAQIARSPQNMGAAAAAPSLEGVSPETRQVVANAPNINTEALRRQADAETLPLPEGTDPMRLRKGQATQDDQQISDEKNMRADPDTQGLLTDSINDQNTKLGQSMGEIRRQATPDIVQQSNADHGQAAIDAIKTQDNAAVVDMRQKYQALANANGGAMPIDAGSAVGAINSELSRGFLTKTAAQDPVISEVLDKLNSGQPMSFEEFENARTNLAAVQRASGPQAKAAAIVRNALENLPLTPEASNLKSVADTARAAAKARYDTIEANPAY
jgi:hypothetical protein